MKCNNHETRDAVGACVTCGLTYCRECLVELDGVYFCKTHVVDRLKAARTPQLQRVHKSYLLTLLFCIFFGYLGVHRFYLGRWGSGLLWLFTGGLFGIGWLIDILLCAMGLLKSPKKYL